MRPDQPLYLKLRRQIAVIILDGNCCDGDALPSVRAFAAETGANPLTVAKAYQAFMESGVIIMRRGVGLFVAEGGRSKLRLMEKKRFLHNDWPSIREEMKRLHLDEHEMVQQALGFGSE